MPNGRQASSGVSRGFLLYGRVGIWDLEPVRHEMEKINTPVA